LAGGALCVALLGSATAQSPDPGGAPPAPAVESRTEGAVRAGTESAAGPAAPEVIASPAIAYQGQLKLGGALVNDTCDMAFRLYDAAAAGNQVGSAISTTLGVNNGLFTSALNFGTSAFTGDARWLEIRVRCPSGVGAHVTLSPRQQLYGAPYALTLRPGATISGTTTNLLVAENYGSGRSAYFWNQASGSAAIRAQNDNSAWGVYALSTSGVGVEGISTFGTGVIGRREATTGTLPAIAGYSDSASSYAVAVLGQINPTSAGASSAAIRGINNSTTGLGIGVWGSQDGSGWGVYGESPSGRGVYGASTDGRGVFGYSANNVAGYFTSNGTTLNAPTIYAFNTNTTAGEPAGIAIYARNAGGDATIVARNTGAGDAYRSLNAAGSVVYAVRNNGRVWTSAVQIYGGGDLAEKFETSGAKPEPGTLMVIDEENPGRLKPSTTAYDHKVAGIVSGAGGVNPGMVLHQEGVLDGDVEVAVVGRVYVKADASNGPIKPGDLLTTSDTPGHAMKASDPARSHGAIIGKAMTALDEGTGLVLVLVNLQ
jgi:hypothetical protein